MSRSVRLVVVGALVLLAATVAARFGASDSHAEFMGNLNATVGPQSVIGLQLPDGTPVTSLGPGTYDIHVSDRATNHNFHLTGPGVDIATSIDEVAEADWTVEIADGGYTYRCDRHPSLMGGFSAGTVAAAPPAPVPVVVVPAPAPVFTPAPVIVSTPTLPTTTRTSTGRTVVSGKLRVTLGSSGTLKVTRDGKAVSKLAAGLYDVVVVDRLPRHDVSVRQIGLPARPLTGKAFTGTRTTRLELERGQWKLYAASAEHVYFAFLRVTA